ncbi:hypothetical protein N5P32_09565 [Marinomonas pontica]|uniref:hypothetical protein n=1 Tax=Marinomonas pontica TaxID=264739 RepID=UPI00224349F9|nr:hypothetical protein [Marinomonas pontica]MCW8356130.1 hypothetical protein [Marinomonas pontica]
MSRNTAPTLLPYYAYDQTADLWRFKGKPTPKSLNELLFLQTEAQQPQTEQTTDRTEDKHTYLKQAKVIVRDCLAGKYTRQTQPFNKEFNDIKRFVLAEDLV